MKQTVFITNVEHGDKIRPVRQQYFKPPYPASATVVVSELMVKGLLLEVEAIAVIG